MPGDVVLTKEHGAICVAFFTLNTASVRRWSPPLRDHTERDLFPLDGSTPVRCIPCVACVDDDDNDDDKPDSRDCGSCAGSRVVGLFF